MLEKIWKHKKDLLNPVITLEYLKRLFQIYIAPPKEALSFIDTDQLPEIYRAEKKVPTAMEPKQVVISPDKSVVFVSCMKGAKLQMFDPVSLKSIKDIKMPEQCVEVTCSGQFAFTTTSNFAREKPLHNKLWVIDNKKGEIVSSVDTQGNWSKFIAISPDGKQALVSNWQSNSISVIDLSNPQKPEVTQIIELRKCPRGIAFTSDGQIAVIANFYSGNVAELRKRGSRWEVSYVSEPFDSPNYSGNLRHVLISHDDQYAYISNIGRNLIHIWSILQRKFLRSIQVGQEPNTIEFANQQKTQILVSCRKSARVCLLDLTSEKVIGVSKKTGDNTTGLCSISDTEFLTTGFDANTLEKYSLT